MWRNLSKLAAQRKLKHIETRISSYDSHLSSNFIEKVRTPVTKASENSRSAFMGFHQIARVSSKKDEMGRPNILNSRNSFGIFGFCNGVKGYATSVAEAISSTDAEDDSSGPDEIQELLEEFNRENKVESFSKQPKKMVDGMGVAKYHSLKKRQIKMETEAWEQAAKEYQELLNDMCEQKLAPNLPFVKSLFLGWFEPLKNAIAADQKTCREKKYKPAHAPYIEQLPADMMAVITMHKLMGLLMTNTGGIGYVTVVTAALNVGEAIENEVRIHKFLEKTKKKKKKKNTSDKKCEVECESIVIEPDLTTKEQERLRKKVTQLLKKQKLKQVREIVRKDDDSKPWDQEAHAKIGGRMLELLIDNAYIQPPVDQLGDGPPDLRPAFVHTTKTITKETQKAYRSYGVIECDPSVRKGLEKTARHMVIPYMPMLVPPLNWTGYDKGAHLFLPSYVMRTHGSRQQRQAVKRTPVRQLQSVFEALDSVGATKWRVNRRVLSVIDRIWASGECIADLVNCEDVPIPEEPDTEDEAELRKWKWKVKDAKKENNERHSQRCDIELKLAVARKMKDEEGFYYPHNLDFRGRAYPMHPYLNHLGSDLCRGILEFAEGRPLGKSGLRWLKIHLANLYGGGEDKKPYDDRVAFAEANLEKIHDSADRPLEGKRWWLKAEDPFQFLATCISLSEALRSPSPETAVSHMPVHQDGSCNGLQHYAALGRDKLGAAAVNLVAGEKPADVYSDIALRVVKIMRKDAEEYPATHPNARSAILLIDKVDRKLVKQTVMTSVYGVTYVGAREQIKRRLKEKGSITDDSEMFGAACYAARTTLTALEEMFQGARSIMSWLGLCAKVIASQNQAVRWTTPLGLPVIQPYRNVGRHLVKTSLQVLTLRRETDKVLERTQRTAFPPNFVHSLDSSHMMMTAVACKKAGLNFAGVHDSYWTHACNVDEMNMILREKFVELYKGPILENLLEGFQNSFPSLKFPPLPNRGDFDIKEVLESPYFFN